ncbi:MAG: SIR2 family protein [Burkholderiaceae bacterium]|nr:SIR2 family protein [Burkholderiaceae bacterium]
MDIPDYLVQQIRAGKAILFLGAGASLGATASTPPTSPPTGKQLGKLLSTQFLGGDSQDKPLTLISEYCIAESDLRTVQQYIAGLFNRFSPSAAQKSIADFRWAALVTTNYDQLIEKAYAENKDRLQTPVPILRNTDRIDYELRAPDAVPLLKLHGCVSMADEVAHPLILTIDQYVNHRIGREKLFNRFTEYAGEYSVVYVGYQIEDSDIRSILLQLNDPSISRPMQYVVSPNPSARDQKIWAEKRITTLAGSFDEFMTELQAKIPPGLRGIRSSTHSHPIAGKFVSHAAPSSDLMAFLANDATYVHAGMVPETSSARTFFRGASLGWGAIAASYDAKRTLSDTVLAEVILLEEAKRPRPTDFYLIKGYAGSGKTVLLKRIALETATTFNKVVLYLRSDARLADAPLAELCTLVGERLFVFVDGVSRRAADLEAFILLARSKKLPITIIATERTNEWNVDGQGLSPLLDGDHELRSLSLPEIDALIAKLEEFKCLGELEKKSNAERREAFLAYANRQLLVALYEITSGAPFQDIVFDEYKRILSDRARRIYLYVCALNRMNVPVRAGLIYRLTGVSFKDFKRDFFSPLEAVVLTEEYKPALDMAYRARHPWVAQVVFERALPEERDRFDLYISILKEIDVGYTPDRAAFRETIRAKNLRELFADPLLVEEIFRTADQASHNDGYVYQQHAIYEFRRQNGNLRRASELISYAKELLPHDRSIVHTMSELEIVRANAAKTEVERKLHLEQAGQYAGRLTGANADSAHGHVTLVKLAMGRLRDVLDTDGADDEDVTAAAKQVEQALGNGLQQFRSDEYLLAAEAEFAGLLHDRERAVKALSKAVAKNPGSTFVARALSRVLELNHDFVGARKTLADALRIAPGDKWLNGSLARLIELRFPEEGREAEACWRRAFTDGDTNYASQFWFARRLYLNGKVDEAYTRFGRLKLARVAFETKVAIAGRIREGGSLKIFEGIISKLESDYGWVLPNGQQRAIYLHSSQLDAGGWARLRRGDALKFSIGFNYMGPAVTFRGVGAL